MLAIIFNFQVMDRSQAASVSCTMPESLVDCQQKGLRFKPRQGRHYYRRYSLLHFFSLPLAPKTNSVMMITRGKHCQWEVKTAKDITGHMPSYADTKKMKSLTLCTLHRPLFFLFSSDFKNQGWQAQCNWKHFCLRLLPKCVPPPELTERHSCCITA